MTCTTCGDSRRPPSTCSRPPAAEVGRGCGDASLRRVGPARPTRCLRGAPSGSRTAAPCLSGCGRRAMARRRMDAGGLPCRGDSGSPLRWSFRKPTSQQAGDQASDGCPLGGDGLQLRPATVAHIPAGARGCLPVPAGSPAPRPRRRPHVMHDGNSSRWRGALGVLCLSVALGSGCATTAPQRTGTLVFEPQQITGDLELSELNDEELFAAGTAAHGSEQWELAARAFDRIIDFHPDSPLVAKARFNAGLAYERLEDWERAHERYSSLADPERGEGDALEASFRAATMRYMLGDLEQAAALLDVLANRQDLPGERRLQAL